MLVSSVPRRGFNVTLCLSVIGVILGGFAVFASLYMERGEGGVFFSSPFGGALARYDMETAAGTARAELEMDLKRDNRAKIEYETRFREKQLKEIFESFKVEKEVAFTRDPDKDAKARKDKGSGEFKILFVSFKLDKEPKKEIMAMEKYTEPNLWRRNVLSPAEVAKKNKELAKEMEDWK